MIEKMSVNEISVDGLNEFISERNESTDAIVVNIEPEWDKAHPVVVLSVDQAIKELTEIQSVKDGTLAVEYMVVDDDGTCMGLEDCSLAVAVGTPNGNIDNIGEFFCEQRWYYINDSLKENDIDDCKVLGTIPMQDLIDCYFKHNDVLP